MSSPRIAVLFWFYKEPEIARNHLLVLKKHNPNVCVFGLFGGKRSEAPCFRRAIGDLLDDFYISGHCRKPAKWKWIHGDQMLLEWFTKRGAHLSWDSVIVVQWDMLVFGSIGQLFPKLKKDQIFLSGLRPMDTEIERRWDWVQRGKPPRKKYLAFRKYVADEYGYVGDVLCCLFILEVFPRRFFEQWATVRKPLIGMLEYAIPTYAKIFNVPFFRRSLGLRWFVPKSERQFHPLNAVEVEVRKEYIGRELKRKRGFRIFHPYFQLWK